MSGEAQRAFSRPPAAIYGGADGSYPDRVVQESQNTATQMEPKEEETPIEVQLSAIRAAVQEAHKSSKSSDVSSGDTDFPTF